MRTTTADWVLTSEAGRALRVSSQWVRHLVDAGILPAVVGPRGIRLIDRRAVEALAREREDRAAVR